MGIRSKETPDFERVFMDAGGRKGRPFRTLWRLYRGQRINLLLSLLFFIIKHSPVWIMSVLTADMINIISRPDADLKWFWIDAAVLIAVVLQNVVTQTLHVSFMSRSSRLMEAGLRGTMMRKLQHLSMSYHSELRSGKMQAKVLRDVEQIELLSKQVMYSFVPAILNIIAAVTIAAATSLAVASLFVVLLPFAGGLVYFFRNKIRQRNRDFRRQIEEMSGAVAESVEMLPVTKAHGLEDIEIEKVNGTLYNLRGKGYRLDITEAVFGASGWVTFTLFQVICLTFTCMLAYQGRIQIGDVVMYQGLFGTIMMSINNLINVYPQFAKGFESIHSVTEVLASTETDEYQGTKVPGSIRGAFRFENVRFHYKDTDKHVLNGFTLDVKPGETIALVGESGAGKSTVLNLAIGFYRPTSGRILLDGVPFDELDMRAYRRQIAVVPQNTVLFSGTIRQNITYGLTNVSEEELERVIRMANLQDVIAAMPDGLDTMIGEHGGKLSGGQRQRIAIARAMIRNPRIIFLDEATSALDNISEFVVQKAMRELIRGRTTFIVAHRLSTIRDADRIVVMKNGRIQEVGSYEELMQRRGEFYQLKQLQA
ncbi:MAG: ABC transporter [Paenibacillaceae bacterium]|nr:MAG: ABC transporter [Paenibacillaceae bacterium]